MLIMCVDEEICILFFNRLYDPGNQTYPYCPNFLIETYKYARKQNLVRNDSSMCVCNIFFYEGIFVLSYEMVSSVRMVFVRNELTPTKYSNNCIFYSKT